MERRFSRTWLDKALSKKERDRLVEFLIERTTAPTGEQILDAIRELFPDKETPSIQSILTWKSKNWAFELSLREMRESAGIAKEITADGNDFGATNKKITDYLVSRELNKLYTEGGVMSKEVHDMILSSVRLGKQALNTKETAAKLELAEAKLSEYRRKDEEREEKKKELLNALQNSAKGRGLTREKVASIEEKLKLL